LHARLAGARHSRAPLPCYRTATHRRHRSAERQRHRSTERKRPSAQASAAHTHGGTKGCRQQSCTGFAAHRSSTELRWASVLWCQRSRYQSRFVSRHRSASLIRPWGGIHTGEYLQLAHTSSWRTSLRFFLDSQLAINYNPPDLPLAKHGDSQ
jgi:hypothetical protein